MPEDSEKKTIKSPRLVTREERQTDGLELSIVAEEEESQPRPGASLSLSALPRTTDEIDIPLVGEKFGKYLLIGELAAGGMAEVSLAVQRGLQGYLKVVTIKRVLPHLNSSPSFIQMFIDEARLGARLEHPNIVRIYEFGEYEGQYFTAMEYLPGEDLTSILNHTVRAKRALPINFAVQLIVQVCSGLHFAHELTDPEGNALGLVHRDVNPSNIVVTYNGEVKVIDFGVAKANTNSSSTLAGTIKGKLAYMAPEQIAAHGVDRRSDVFSTGVVLWELLTARPLFARESEAATLFAIVNDPIPSVRSVRPDIPRELDGMISRALARNPADRFESCEVMQYALESFLGTQPKIDARGISKLMEQLFGPQRAIAKRSIAQTRSLARNVSLVMKLRTDVRRDLLETLDGHRHEQRAGSQDGGADAPAARAATASGRRQSILVVGIMLAAAASGLGYLTTRTTSAPEAQRQTTARATISVDSNPPGAAIMLGHEPTGLKTPSQLVGLPPGPVKLRIELPGHEAVEATVDVREGEATARTFELRPLIGRLILAELPAGASLWIDNAEQLIGQVITLRAGPHLVRIDLGDKQILRQTIETGVGDQIWELRDQRLIQKAKP